MKASETFMVKLSEMEENGRVSPVIQDDQVSYIYIQYSNLYLLALSRNNSNAVAILAFLHKLVNIFKHYFREVSLFGCMSFLKQHYFMPPFRSCGMNVSCVVHSFFIPSIIFSVRRGVFARQFCYCL